MDIFDCLIVNTSAKKALEDYAVTLQKLFKQYRNLWEDYIKLQEIHEQCNINCSFEIDNQLGVFELTPEKPQKKNITDNFCINSPDINNKSNNITPISPIFHKSELKFKAVEPAKNTILFNKPKVTNTERNIEHKCMDNNSLTKLASGIKNDNAMNTEDSQDIIELSPQISVKSKVKDFLREKKKFCFDQTVKSPLNKNKYFTLDREKQNMKEQTSIAHSNIDKVNYTTYNKKKTLDFSIEDLNTIETLKENSNPSDLLSLQKYNDTDTRINKYKEVQQINQMRKTEKQEICRSTNKNNSTQKNETDSFNLDYTDNIQNKSPIKRTLFEKSNTLPKTKQDVCENFRIRCKTERRELKGYDCWECKSYYQNLPLQKRDLQKRKNLCSRHRSKYPKPHSPEGFWNPEFSD